ncbi:MAG TPA: DUF4224 domain-containing protein [Burkholderiales bacterium]|nr:DUF4224 domain-containing protein [Burkholderiales bacterium]
MSVCLSPVELTALTGKVRPHAQARVLDALVIPYRKRPDNSLIVFRYHVTPDAPPQERSASPVLHLP